jgi:hypothetical protein
LLECNFQTLNTVENGVTYISQTLSKNNTKDGDFETKMSTRES